MKKIEVSLVIQPANDPRAIAGGLAKLTQIRKQFNFTDTSVGEAILDNLVSYGHTSLLEPMHFGLIIHGASRVFLSQITRHRMVTFVSQSQQYQDQHCFPYLELPDLENLPQDIQLAYHDFMRTSERLYNVLKAAGVPRDQARYVIPNAVRNDLFMYANAREFVEVIFPQRICRRNTLETRYIMSKILKLFFENGYDYLFKHTGPACITRGKCDQGKMACGRPFKCFDEMLKEDEI